MFIFSLTGVGLWGLGLARSEVRELFDSSFCIAVLIFFLLYTVLEFLLSLFAKGAAASVMSVLPAIVIYFPLKDIESMPYLQAAVLTSVCLKLFISFVPFPEKTVLFGNLILMGAAVFLRFSYGAFYDNLRFEAALFICLLVLTLSGLQYLVAEKGKEPFPFSFFVILGSVMLFLPIKEQPIDWSPVLEAGERIVGSMESTYSDVFYFFSGLFESDRFAAGYSSLEEAGGGISGKSRNELILRPGSKTYVLFEDEETGKQMKRRKAIYLNGGRGVEKEKIVEYLSGLYRADVTPELARVFSQKIGVDIEYVYVRTADEIVPDFSIDIMSNGRNVKGGRGDFVHKKGYTINATYIDIDYASPYYASILQKAGGNPGEKIPYKELYDYARRLYGFNLAAIVSEDEYAAMAQPGSIYAKNCEEYLDTSGCSPRLRELAKALTKDLDNDYDKCRIIEEYLRQYPYSTKERDAGIQNMATAEGMSALAEEFLFKKGKGYCVHYASSMVMLLRLSGIPARCEVGYNYLYPFEEQEEYYVSGARAHTWPEAFIKGGGWIPFEPTGAYLSAEQRTWNREPEIKEMQQVPDYAAEYGSSQIPDIARIMDESLEEAKESRDTYSLVNVAVLVVISAVILVLLLILGTVLIRELMYRNASYENKLRMDVDLIKKDIRKHTEDFPDRGLLSDYAKRAPEALKDSVGEIFGIYYRAEYAKGPESAISEDDSLRAMNIRKLLHSSYKKKKKVS